MVLHKWALVTRPPPAMAKPAAALKRVVFPSDVPDDRKPPYVMRPFIKEAHVERVQHIENRGMFKEELDIERSRFPKINKSLLLMTDGSLDEREFECLAPPMTILFNDRTVAHKSRVQLLVKAGVTGKSTSWTNDAVQPPSEQPLCNALAFPFAVAKPTVVRRAIRDVLLGEARSAETDGEAEM